MGFMRSITVFSGVTFFGVFIAAILYEMNNRGYLIDELVSGSIVITDVMILVVVFFMIIGGLLAAVTR